MGKTPQPFGAGGRVGEVGDVLVEEEPPLDVVVVVRGPSSDLVVRVVLSSAVLVVLVVVVRGPSSELLVRVVLSSDFVVLVVLSSDFVLLFVVVIGAGVVLDVGSFVVTVTVCVVSMHQHAALALVGFALRSFERTFSGESSLATISSSSKYVPSCLAAILLFGSTTVTTAGGTG